MLLFIDFCWSRLLVKKCPICCCCDNHDFLNQSCHLIVCSCTSWNSLFLWDKWKRKSVVSAGNREHCVELLGISITCIAELIVVVILGLKKRPKNKWYIQMWTLVFLDKAKSMSNKPQEARFGSLLFDHIYVLTPSFMLKAVYSLLWGTLVCHGHEFVWTSMLEKEVRPQRECAKIHFCGKTSLGIDFIVKSFWGILASPADLALRSKYCIWRWLLHEWS